MLERLASWSFRHRWTVVVAWLVAAVAVTMAAGAFGGDYADGGRLKGTDSDAAYQLVQREFPAAVGEEATVVFADPAGLADDRPAIEAYLAQVRSLARVAEAPSPFDGAGSISADGTVAYTSVTFDAADGAALEQGALAVRDAAASLRSTGLRVEFGGWWYQDGGVPSSELFGVGAAAVILLLAFGSVVAMGLPLLTAVFGILIALAGVTLWSAAVPTPDFTVQVASMIGIGVGIDYALFIVTRYRTALAAGRTPHDAAVEAIGTAGRAVLFAGGTVMISLLGMLLMGMAFFQGLAFGSSSAVLIAMLAAVTLLPALLGIAGRRIDRLSIHRRRPSLGAGRRAETGWHRWSRLVQRHPVAFAAAGITALLVTAAPVLGMRLASADAGNDAKGTTTRNAYDLLADGFGAGVNGPLLLAVEVPTPTAQAALPALVEAVRATPGVAFVTEPQFSPAGTTAIVTALPTTSPQSRATEDLVHRLRTDVLPPLAGGDIVAPAGGHLVAHVGGATASNVDFAQLMSDRLPIFIGAVLVCSFLLLLVVFRSVLVPLKAVVMNLLSIGAAYGAMVAVFQWGWLSSFLGSGPGAPIEPWAPMMLFAIVFGLSMDYEVFLLSSVKERYDATGDNTEAVVEGLASTARVITAAAAIMVCVFGSFVVGDVRSIKLIGFGLAFSVLVDATIVRMIVVPATMELLGARNWWLPRWLDRLLPNVHLEGSHGAAAPERARIPVDVG